ncbi:Gfo/Idh/MocA family protein [Empedobacter falsenii]|jgi:predicted dehydrogenase|uniref:Gfo/Idh/MocA family protein n=1 Tax=Empedobacter TaxID=59734 RepID=UPI002576C5CB|nr:MULTISPECIES: Gfo/Idh/MocA family oxidoreductase [Empedobacter]MDM1040888.1 Gfo/Idh/MocA family oxidoreductase [Empedobacter brevis]MDM1134469.1 Gfo/Idh/MocA family oxidoreductase [Empedobacter sp. R750]
MKNFSILGYGHIGRVHQQAIEETENAQLISVIDFNLPEDLPFKGYSTLESFLNEDQETDVVVIATPNGLHREHAIRCLKAGKNVLIEKPIALTVEDAKEILKVAEEKNLRVFTSMQLRFSPVVQYVKNLIDNNSLGKVFMVNINCYWNRNKNYYKLREWHGNQEMDGGVLFTQFSHFVDIMNFWFDEVICTNSKSFNFTHQEVTEFDDSGCVDFTADGAIGHMIYTTSVFNKNFESNITLIAEKGTIKIGDQYLNQMIYSDLKNVCCSNKISTEQKNFHPNAIAEISDALIRHNESLLDGKYAVNLVKFISDANHLATKNKQELKTENYEISHS